MVIITLTVIIYLLCVISPFFIWRYSRRAILWLLLWGIFLLTISGILDIIVYYGRSVEEREDFITSSSKVAIAQIIIYILVCIISRFFFVTVDETDQKKEDGNLDHYVAGILLFIATIACLADDDASIIQGLSGVSCLLASGCAFARRKRFVHVATVIVILCALFAVVANPSVLEAPYVLRNLPDFQLVVAAILAILASGAMTERVHGCKDDKAVNYSAIEATAIHTSKEAATSVPEDTKPSSQSEEPKPSSENADDISLNLKDCPHCSTKRVLPMPGNICPNCKKPLDVS